MRRLIRVIVSVVLLVLSLLGVVFLVWPKYQEFSLLRSEVAQKRERLESGQQALTYLKKVQEEAQAHQHDFEKIDKAIPSDAGLPVVYEHIQHLASSSGLLLNSLEGQAAPEQNSEITKLRFEGSFSGSYEGLKVFLREIKRSARIVHVNSVDISSTSQESGTLNFQTELILYATTF